MPKKLKFIVSCFLCLFSVILLSSCEKTGTELSELMIMQGIGIDVTDNGYKVTVEILNNEQSGSPSGDGSSENKTKIYSAEGKTISEALRTLVTKSGNEPLFAHNRVIILGKKTVEQDLNNITDFFERDYDSRASQLICVAKNETAEEIIRANLLKDGVKCEILENMLEEGYINSIIPRVRIIDAVNYTLDSTSGLCIPAVSVQKNDENENYVLDGCCVFGTDNTFLKYIDANTAEGLSFLSNKVQKGFITAELSNGEKATFLINKCDVKYDIKNKNGALEYNLKIKLSCDLDDIQGQEFFSNDTEILSALQKGVGEEVCRKVENTFITMQNYPAIDAVQFSKRLRLKDNELYHSLSKDWNTAFSKIKMNVFVDVTIRRIGEETFRNKKSLI